MAEVQMASETAENDVSMLGERGLNGRVSRLEENGDGISPPGRPRRQTRQNTRLNSEELVAEKLMKLNNSRSGHAGHLTYLANKISTLLTDNSNIKTVKELSVMFDRQWDRFELVHDEILVYASQDELTKENAFRVYNEQSQRKLDLFEKILQYLDRAEDRYDQKQTLDGNVETPRKSSDYSPRTSISSSSTKSLGARLKREKAELSLRQLRERQTLERKNEQRLLELRHSVEQQKLENELTLAQLDEHHEMELSEEELISDNDSTRSASQNESAYRYATPRSVHLDKKGETLFPNQNRLPSSIKKLDKSPVRQTTSATATSTPVEATATNPIQQLAEAIANTTQIPPMSVTKFTGDPREYTRFVSRFTDQILSLPIHESRKLSCLMQYVDGDAKEAIEDFEGMGVGALKDALGVLKLRFGQPYMIVDACIGEIVDGRCLAAGDGRGIQKLADRCQMVYKTLNTMKCLHEINTDHMRKIVARLPFHNQARWRDRVSKILKSSNSRPTFGDLVEYLQERSSSENNPLYRKLPGSSKKDDTKPRRKSNLDKSDGTRISSFATQFDSAPSKQRHDERSLSCPRCYNKHHLSLHVVLT
jgi:hypothetical protein